jgi:hypothetical protein
MDFASVFKSNPAFYIEVGRVKAGVTDCVLPLHPFKAVVLKYRSVLANILANGRIPNESIEKSVESEIKKLNDYGILKGMDLEVVASATILNRILSTVAISPDIFIYICDASKVKSIRKKLKRIKSLEIKAISKNSLEYRLEINKIEGELLCYPECCINSFIELKQKSVLGGQPPETKAIVECIERGLFSDILKLLFSPKSELPEEIYAFFTSNFYPCRIDCEKAIEIGKSYEERLAGIYKTAYRCKLILNATYCLISAFESYKLVKAKKPKTEFGKTVLEFFDSLPSDKKEKLDKISKLLAIDPLDFENRFILMHLD